MDFSFNARTFRDLLHNAVAEYLGDEDLEVAEQDKDNANSPKSLLMAMDQAIDVMLRADADGVTRKAPSAGSMGVLEQKDISKIGQYALDLLEGIVALIQDKTGEQSRDLLRLSLPVSLWVARHGGIRFVPAGIVSGPESGLRPYP